MKKLLAVLLVLGLASFAAASDCEISITGPVVIPAVGQSVVIKVMSTTDLLGLDTILTSADPGIVAITAATSKAGAAGAGWDPDFSFDAAITDAAGEIGLGTFSGKGAGQVATYTITGVSVGTTMISLAPGAAFGGSAKSDFSAPTICGDMEITVVPEPMTMSLLGLGGLALIRRRRA